MKKRIFCVAMVAIMMLSMGIMASAEYAANRNSARVSTTSNDIFSFWMENYGGEVCGSNGVYKANDIDFAYVACDENTIFWPVDGVTMRVKDGTGKNATEAREFANGQIQFLDYLEGQATYGTKYLYGGYSNQYDPYSTPLRASGEWRP